MMEMLGEAYLRVGGPCGRGGGLFLHHDVFCSCCIVGLGAAMGMWFGDLQGE
jgi:hypothetical protein